MYLFKKILFLLPFLTSFAISGAEKNNNIAEWDFSSRSVLQGKYAVALRGNSRLTSDGLAVNSSDVQKSAGAILKKTLPETNPENAFAIKTEFIISGQNKPLSNTAMLYDTKYVAIPRDNKQMRYHRGFMLYLFSHGNNVYQPGAAFGFGNTSSRVSGKKITVEPGLRHTLEMHFSATGKVEFIFDGKSAGKASVPAGTIAKPEIKAVFGDRAGAVYQPFPGTICKVKLEKKKFVPVEFIAEPSSRMVFERLEKSPQINISIRNFSNINYPELTIHAEIADIKIPPEKISKLSANSELNLKFHPDNTLLPGNYQIKLYAADKMGRKIAENNFEFTIVPSYGDFMPVLLWGNYEDIKTIKDLGFTHQIVHLFPRNGNFKQSSLNQWIPHLDANLKERLYTFVTVHSHFRYLQTKRHLRTGRDGKTLPRPNLEASHPDVRKEFSEAAASTAEALADHPALDGALINSEVRDSSFPSFKSGVEPANFKKFAGYEIPSSITGKSPMPYSSNPTFPWDKVIPDDFKELVFLRWFWDSGDGWNPLQTLLSDTFHKKFKGKEHKKRFFTFYDPATRVPPMWGSGGNVDMISQWTYSYPDPIKIGQTTDEIIAMAHGKPGQKIGSMTQAIWYRSQTAPISQKVKNPPEWLKHEPQAAFISISPDSLREAYWIKISRRLDAIMYHGVGSLIAPTNHKLYRFTNPESKKVLKELNTKITLPLGPVLKKVPERPFKIAILENLASSFYAPKHFPMGWGKGWIADLHLALQWGHLQSGIIYDEHLLKNTAIENLKVLFVPGLEVVTESVLKKLNELRSRGVIIIGDEFTTPALMLDHRIKSVSRVNTDPAGSKKALQKLGKELAELLKEYNLHNAIADNQDLIIYSRGNNAADYLFVVNDRRTAGDYVGQWGLVQEKGLANSGTVTVAHPAAAAYDLLNHKPIKLEKQKNSCSFKVELGPGEGLPVLLLDREIAAVKLDLPENILRNKPYNININILDNRNNNIKAFIPLEISIIAADGKKLPGSGFYAAENGSLKIAEVMASNASAGQAEITVRCLASGKTVSRKFTVR